MLTATLALALLFAPSAAAQDSPPMRPVAVIPVDGAPADVLAPVEAVFESIRTRDAAAFALNVDPAARLTAVVQGPNGAARVISMAPADFAATLRPGGPEMEEVMVDPYVSVDGDVAVVWGRYLFRVDGRTVHCGVDHFDLVRRDGAWIIVNLTWNQRTTGCDEIEALAAAR